MYEQLSIFDWMPTLMEEPEVGEYLEKCGAVICHIMRSDYIGRKVLYDCSTQSHTWYRCGILEQYIPYERWMRSVIFTGEKQRILLTHYPGREIYECLPWDAYPKRNETIYRRNRND